MKTKLQPDFLPFRSEIVNFLIQHGKEVIRFHDHIEFVHENKLWHVELLKIDKILKYGIRKGKCINCCVVIYFAARSAEEFIEFYSLVTQKEKSNLDYG